MRFDLLVTEHKLHYAPCCASRLAEATRFVCQCSGGGEKNTGAIGGESRARRSVEAGGRGFYRR